MPKVSSDKASALLGLIQTSTEPSSLAPSSPETNIATPAIDRVPAALRPKGKRVTIFLHEGDRRLIRELMAYLAGQGRRVSESIAIKAALRMAKPGNELLLAHEEAAAQDRRFKNH